jgi:uncharacterized membrane protein
MRPLSFAGVLETMRYEMLKRATNPVSPVAVALLALATGLAAAPVAAADVRGFASAGPLGVILFQPCEGRKLSARALTIDDVTPESALSAGIADVRQIMYDSSRPLYVEFTGEAAGNSVRATRFQRAVGTIESCAVAGLPAGAKVWAGGEEPGWRLLVTAREARLERAGEKPVRFPAAPFLAPHKGEGPRVIDAWSSLDGGSVRVELTEQMCSDGRSETAYGAHATLRYGSRTYEGCAARF